MCKKEKQEDFLRFFIQKADFYFEENLKRKEKKWNLVSFFPHKPSFLRKSTDSFLTPLARKLVEM